MNIKELLEIPNITYAIAVADGLYKEKFAPAKTVQQVDQIRKELDSQYTTPPGKKILNAFRLRKIKEIDPAEFQKRMGELTLREEVQSSNTFSDLLDFYVDQIPGGKADSKSPYLFDRKQLIIGFFVEREHSNDPLKRIEISCDHLSDDEQYYTKLVESGVVDEPKALEMYKKFFGDVKAINEAVEEKDMLDIKSITAEKALENKSLGKLIGYNDSFTSNQDGSATKKYFPVYLDVKKNGKGKVTVYAFDHYKSDKADKLTELGKTELDANALNVDTLKVFVRKHNSGKPVSNEWKTASGKLLAFDILVKAYMNIYLKILNQK